LDQVHTLGNVRSLIMSDVLDNSRVLEILGHGAHGVVPRRTTQELLKKSIQTVLDGGFWISRSIVSDLVQFIRESASSKRPRMADVKTESSEGAIARLGLTRREVQIIGALVDGQTNKDIASTFSISEYTVKHHLTNIYDKLGVYNRVELVLFTINHGLCASPGLVPVMALAAR
jgi:DNA-binding NarL/FixJ family response regulator